MTDKLDFILNKLQEIYPNTKTFLNYKKDYELLFAIILSAQATDISVNKATEKLFKLCPTLEDYNPSNLSLIYDCIKAVGLASSKGKNIIACAKKLLDEHYGKVPTSRDELEKLPGVGHKTAAVFLGEYYNLPYIPVDTHVFRVSHRLNLVGDEINTADKTEEELERYIKNDRIQIHRRLILFGRNICKAKAPTCDRCPFVSFCTYNRD